MDLQTVLSDKRKNIYVAFSAAMLASFPNIICLPYEWECHAYTSCRPIIALYFILRLIVFASLVLLQISYGQKHILSAPGKLLRVYSAFAALIYFLFLPLSFYFCQYIPTDARGSVLVFQICVLTLLSLGITLLAERENKIKTSDPLDTATDGHCSRLLIGRGDKIFPIDIENIIFIHSSDRKTTVATTTGERFPYALSLDKTMTMLDGSRFYRVNKQFIIAKEAVSEIIMWFDNRLLVKLGQTETPEPIYVSKNKAAAFKRWMAE